MMVLPLLAAPPNTILATLQYAGSVGTPAMS
jgi:hypothetical protein